MKKGIVIVALISIAYIFIIKILSQNVAKQEEIYPLFT